MMASSASTRTQMKWQSLEEERKHQQKKSAMGRPSSSASSGSQEVVVSISKDHDEEDHNVCSSNGGCSTPKAKRFRIPEVLTCPPAPKKRRVIQNYSSKPPISFFASPDIELFFFSALRNVSSA